MTNMGADDDFFEEDENVEDLLAAFDQAEEKGKTRRPASGQTEYLTIFGMAARGLRHATQKSANNVNLFAA